MRELINKTGLQSFGSGQQLTSDAMNNINNTLNKCVETCNSLLLSDINICAETEDYNTTYDSLSDVLDLVPKNRRVEGIKIRFKETILGWVEYVFLGGDWSNLDRWRFSLRTVIDGGEW